MTVALLIHGCASAPPAAPTVKTYPPITLKQIIEGEKASIAAANPRDTAALIHEQLESSVSKAAFINAKSGELGPAQVVVAIEAMAAGKRLFSDRILRLKAIALVLEDLASIDRAVLEAAKPNLKLADIEGIFPALSACGGAIHELSHANDGTNAFRDKALVLQALYQPRVLPPPWHTAAAKGMKPGKNEWKDFENLRRTAKEDAQRILAYRE
jgi:hypothetical protein